MTKRWVLGGERLHPTLALAFGVGWTLVAAGWILLAFDGDQAAWKHWIQLSTGALLAPVAAYYWALYTHLRRDNRRS
ncbi:hypothetical protein [Amycolatopsis sp. NPDC098790]|uniref:hypothetical protein n=1 Tax=Amycolatopsis sp. NPDC098790 TaxID=3363939 RepID=UPI00381D499B